MSDEAFAYSVVALHLGITLFPPLGAFLILRWPRFVRIHVPIMLWAFSIPFLQYPCPLTDLEKELRGRADMPVYEGNFIEHYFYQSLGPHGHLIWDNFNWICPAVAYALYFRRPRRTVNGSR